MIPKTIEDVVGPVDWVRDGMGYITCPGDERHSQPSKPRDCALYLDKVPTIFCLHTQCKSEIKAANVNLRDALRGNTWKPKQLTSEDKERIWLRQDMERQARRLARNKEWVLESYRWPLSDIVADSAPVSDEWHQFLNIWKEGDTMWCGEPTHSGQFAHSDHFRTMGFWKGHNVTPHHYVCGSAFRSGSYSRTKDSLAARRFLIVECDTLHENPVTNKDLSGAVLNYTRQQGWTLRAIIDSGNKSIHGWFDYPGEEQERWATIVLPALGVDTATLRSTQPVRAPGIARENGQLQKLIWIK